MTVFKSDSKIKENILDELKWNPEINETDIGVIVKNGAVTLTGTVPSYAQKTAAVHAASTIKGVLAIADEIEVKLSYETEGTDKDIAERIAHIFEWNTVVSGNDIQAEVRSGCVTLKGSVDWQYQRTYAQRQVESLKGVRLVFNNLKIRERASIANVKHQIIKALHRHANFEAGRISIALSDGTITLNGNADSYFEKDLIRNAAWATPGVTKVIDNISIAPVYSEAA